MKRLLFVLACVLLAAVPSQAQVVFDANATADCTQNAVSTIDCSTLTVGAGANRALICQIGWSGAVTSPTLTWDNGATNQAMTLVTGATATNTAMVSLYGLVAPTSGAKQLHVAWTTARDVVVNCVSWTGVDQTGGATSFPHGTSATGTGTSAQGVTVTSATNNAVMGVFATASAAIVNSVNNTQTFRDNTPATFDTAGNRAAGAATVAMTATYSASSVWAAAGTDILASGGAAPACPPTLTLLGVGRC